MGYATPEQFGGMGQSDARTDIYGLGVTLYHAITGINPSEPHYEIKPIRDCNPTLSKEPEQIVNSGIGAQTKMEMLSLIPVDSTVSIQMYSEQVRFDRNEFELLWSGQISYSRFKVQKVTSQQPMISIETKIKVNGEPISTISFETKY